MSTFDSQSLMRSRRSSGDAVAILPSAFLAAAPSPVLSFQPNTRTYLVLAPEGATANLDRLARIVGGDAVVCDRFVDSSVAYQGAGRKLGLEQVAALNAMAVGETMPDITVYLRMPADVALSRRLSASKPDRLEQEKADFFSRTYQAYEQRFAGQGKRVMTVNAAQSIEQVTQAMLDGLDERLSGLGVE